VRQAGLIDGSKRMATPCGHGPLCAASSGTTRPLVRGAQRAKLTSPLPISPQSGWQCRRGECRPQQ
jgi:hypothetical protein